MPEADGIREAVEAELDFDPMLDGDDITVQYMDGDLTLMGSVSTYPQSLAASAAAQRVRGVANVHNRLEVWLLDRDYRDDTQLTRSANTALTEVVLVPAGIEARAEDGNVVLTGAVSVGGHRDAAAAAVATLIGVRNVTNNVAVSSKVNLRDVEAHVDRALARNVLVQPGSDVSVDAQGRTITLTGHVRSWSEHSAVVDTAWRAEGVEHVRAALVITG